MQWDIWWFPQSACFYLFCSLLIQLLGFRLRSTNFPSLLILVFNLAVSRSPSLRVVVSQTAFLLSSLVLHPFPPSCPSAFPRSVKPSDCRVKLWNYVPGLTPCLPRRVLAIKGRATSLPWLPVLCSPILPSSGTVLTHFLFLLLAIFSFPYFEFSYLGDTSLYLFAFLFRIIPFSLFSIYSFIFVGFFLCL